MGDVNKFDASNLQITLETPLMGEGVNLTSMGFQASQGPAVKASSPDIEISNRILPPSGPGGR